ncbi:MAG: indole-3-glycerol phosphate synthase TrpC [Gemmatimonadetes bacterium]|nr:indole-3-glycerol phosphate synthase TrpC [Gemmatimonadota bacterium]
MTISSEPTVLDRILATKREEVAELAPQRETLRDRARDLPPARGFGSALRVPGTVQVLAEIKRRSPSAGPIRPDADAAAIARDYRAGGAAALSVLTDRSYFGGSLAVLEEVRAAVELPLLRKDFIIDPVQVWEARAAGADAILLIVRALEPDQLSELLGLAEESGLDTLIEVHDSAELELAVTAGGRLIGVNNRDLATFRTDLELSVRLAAEIPADITLVAESGIRTAEDVRRLGESGVDAVLVGESLMRQEDVRAAVSALTGQPSSPRSR